MKPSKLVYANILVALVSFLACQPEVKQENKVSDIPQASNTVSPPDTLGDKAKDDSQELDKYFRAGNDYSESGQFVESIKAYHQAIKINSTVPVIHYNLANVYVATGEIDDAIQEYKLAIALNPLIPDYHRNLGFAYALQKNGDMAKVKYEELKKMAPAQAEELWQWIQKGNQGG